MQYERIRDLNELKQLSDGEELECFILAGALRFSKTITYNEGSRRELWEVYNESDDSTQTFRTDEKMLTGTTIGDALNNGNLYKY